MRTLFQSVISAFVISKSGDEDYRNSIPSTLERALHVETSGIRHLNVCNDAADIIDLPRIEKLIDRGVRLCIIAGGFHEPLYRSANRSVIVYYRYQRRFAQNVRPVVCSVHIPPLYRRYTSFK